MPRKFVSWIAFLCILILFSFFSAIFVYGDELEFSSNRSSANQTEAVTFSGKGGTPEGVFTLRFTNSGDEIVWAVQDTFSASGEFEYELRIPLEWEPGSFTVFLRDDAADYVVSNDIFVHEISFPPPVAIFELTNLLVDPSEVRPDEEVTVSVMVSNIGEIASVYAIELLLDYEVRETQWVTLGVGHSSTVVFSVASDIVGIHVVEIGDLLGGFNVVERQLPINPWVFVDLSVILIAIGGILYLKKMKMI